MRTQGRPHGRNLREVRDLDVPGKRPGNVLPWPTRYSGCPQPRQRPRVEQSGKRETARNAVRRSDASCASGVFLRGNGRESTAPGAASAARAGVRVSFAGRSAVLQRGRSGPACLRNALRCSCRAVACGDRGVSFDMGRRPLVRRRWRLGYGVSYRIAGDASPAVATTSSATTVPASIKDFALSRRAPRTFRRFHEAAALPCPDVTYSHSCDGPAHPSIRPRRPSTAWRIRADGVHLPMRSAILPHRNRVAPRRRQPSATTAPPTPDSRRLSGLPV